MQPTSKIQNLCAIGLMTAIIAITAQIALPLPAGVPMTLQSFGIMLAGIVLGPKKGACATIIYLLIGLSGVPVFAHFTGGYQCFVSPTGGFLLSFPLLAFLSGLGRKHKSLFAGAFFIFLAAGNVINLLCGAIVFSLISNCTFLVALSSCVLPFLPITLLKMILAQTTVSHFEKRV